MQIRIAGIVRQKSTTQTIIFRNILDAFDIGEKKPKKTSPKWHQFYFCIFDSDSKYENKYQRLRMLFL